MNGIREPRFTLSGLFNFLLLPLQLPQADSCFCINGFTLTRFCDIKAEVCSNHTKSHEIMVPSCKETSKCWEICKYCHGTLEKKQLLGSSQLSWAHRAGVHLASTCCRDCCLPGHLLSFHMYLELFQVLPSGSQLRQVCLGLERRLSR